MSMFEELRPFQINAAQAMALAKVIIDRSNELRAKNGEWGQWKDWREMEEYLLLREVLERLHETTQGRTRAV